MRVLSQWLRASAIGISLTGLLVLLLSGIAHGVWKMEIESKTVTNSQTGVTLNITYAWDIKLYQATLPLVVRSLDPTQAAFWAGTLPYDTLDDETSEEFSHGVVWNALVGPWSVIIKEVSPNVLGKPTQFRCNTESDTAKYDGLPNDYFVINNNGMSSLAAKPNGVVWVTLTFDVTKFPGQFEFDTACFGATLNTIFMIDGNVPNIDHGPQGTNEVVFNKGVVTIAGNDYPEIVPIPDKQVQSGGNLNFIVSATDPNGTKPALSVAEDSDLLGKFTFTDHGDGTATFDFNPTVDLIGDHGVHFLATDAGGLADSAWARITVTSSGILEETGTPAAYSLSQNFPNPFNASTLIEFSLEQPGPVKLEVYNILGQKVAVLVDEVRSAGKHSVTWNGKDTKGKPVPSGMYFYRLTAGGFTEMKKMVLMK